MRKKAWIPAVFYPGLRAGAAALILAALFFISACSSAYEAHKGKAAKMNPGAKYNFEGNTVRYTDKELTIEASFLSPDQVDLYFSLFKGGKYQNPFPEKYFVFQLSLENRGKKNVVFNPGMTHLVPKKGMPSPPKDFTSFFSDLELANAEDTDGKVEAFKASVFDTAATIRPGEKAQGLIVFSLDKSVQNSGVLVLNDIFIGSASRTVPCEFNGNLSCGRPPQ